MVNLFKTMPFLVFIVILLQLKVSMPVVMPIGTLLLDLIPLYVY
jgi:hypothetical protein